MKTFRQHCIEEGVLDDVLNLGSKFMYFWKGLWVMNTKHGMERIIQRAQLGTDQLKKLFKTAIEKFKTMSTKTGDAILFFSRSLNQGFVAGVGPQGNLRLITFLPRGKSFAKDGTEKIVMEGEEIEITHRVEID